MKRKSYDQTMVKGEMIWLKSHWLEKRLRTNSKCKVIFNDYLNLGMKDARMSDRVKTRAKVYIWIFCLRIKLRAKNKSKEVKIRFFRPVNLNSQHQFSIIISLIHIRNLRNFYLINIKIVRSNLKKNKYSCYANNVILKFLAKISLLLS